MRKAVAHLQDDKKIVFEMEGYEINSSISQIAGGDGAYPSPGLYFISALVNCALSTLITFCSKRDIPTQGIQIEFQGHSANEIYESMEYVVTLPAGFPEKYKDSVPQILDACTVKKYAQNLPPVTYIIK